MKDPYVRRIYTAQAILVGGGAVLCVHVGRWPLAIVYVLILVCILAMTMPGRRA